MADDLHKAHVLSWYLAGDLSPSDQQAIANHLKSCVACQQELLLLQRTIAALQLLPLEEPAHDFVERLNQRLDRETKRSHVKKQQKRPSLSLAEPHSSQEVVSPSSELEAPVLVVLGQKMHDWWYSLRAVFSMKMLAYSGAVMLGLAALLMWRISSEKTIALPTQPAPLAPASPVPLSSQTASVAGTAIQPVETVVSMTDKPSLSIAPLTSSPATPPAATVLVWHVAGEKPVSLHEQVKALVGRMAGALIVKEEKHLLLISLPTRELPALRRELTKIGEVSPLDTEAVLGDPATTLLQVMFVQQLAASLPAGERFPSPSAA
jgi:anti-sigma factor RsiW